MTDQSIEKLSPSVMSGLSVSRKASEGLQLFREYRERAQLGHNFEPLFGDIDEYQELLRRHAGVGLHEARVLEVGFGARPYRQMILHSMGVDASGVDAEVPRVSGRPAEFLSMIKQNGVERAAKTLLRYAFFDRGERRSFTSSIRRHGLTPYLDASRLLVGDAGQLELAPSSLDLVFSEDVFEHIEQETLKRLVPRMAQWLRPGGLALIRPNIFTGIVGGHLLEWSRASMQRPPAQRSSEPWEHLRKRRFAPNTSLNEMTRSQYRELFARSFEILEERVSQPDLGRDYLDADAARDLASWSEDELFSNQTLFVLRPHKTRRASRDPGR